MAGSPGVSTTNDFHDSNQLMKILIVTNFYPPVIFGGYEIGCAQVTEGLQQHDCQVQVLTSTSVSPGYNRSNSPSSMCLTTLAVHRQLLNSFGIDFSIYPWWRLYWRAFWQEYRNQILFQQACKTFKPDIVYFWNQAHISNSFYEICQVLKIKFGVFVFDHSLMKEDATPWGIICKYAYRSKLKQILQYLLRKLLQSLGCCIAINKAIPDFIHYPTHYLQGFYAAQGIKSHAWLKVNWGVDIHKFKLKSSAQSDWKLLYVGQVSRHKGVHIALQVLAILRNQYGYTNTTLTIIGQCLALDYEKQLQALIDTHDLSSSVQFQGFVEREALPEIYADHTILIFPSLWEEPMGIVILEAMAIGLVVVASRTGGVPELIEEGLNGLLFEPGHSEMCANQIKQLIDNPLKLSNLSQNARKTVETRFEFSQTLHQIYQDLLDQSGYLENDSVCPQLS